MDLKQLSALCCTVLCLTGPTTALAATDTTQAVTSQSVLSDTTTPRLSFSPSGDGPASTDPFPSLAASAQASQSASPAGSDDSDATAETSDAAADSTDSADSDESDATADASDAAAPVLERAPAYVEPETIVVSSHKVQVNGVPATPQAYTIDRYNYFKLRDIAYLLDKTAVSFDLNWDNDTRTIDIIPCTAYTVVGGEMETSPRSLKTLPSTASVTMQGKPVTLQGYSINGNNYYKIADLAKIVGFQALFDNDTRTVHIVTPDMDPSSTVVPTTDPSDTIADPNISIDGEKPQNGTPEGEAPYPTDSTDPEHPGSSVDFPNPIGSNSPTDPDTTAKPDHKPAIDPELGDPEDETPSEDQPGDKTDDPEDKKDDEPTQPTDPAAPTVPADPTEPTEPDEPTVPPRTSHLDGVRTVIIDAGHGGGDLGASHPTLDLDEKHVNLYVAQYLKAYLETAGVKVIMVRDTLEEGAALPLRGTVMEENLETVDLFFGLHHNAANTQARGAQVLAQVADEENEDGPSRILAEELNKEYEKIGLTVRPIWFRHGDRGDYYYTNRKAAELQIVAVISEFCFIDNDEDVLFVDSKIDWQTEAKGLSRAILRYFEQVEY